MLSQRETIMNDSPQRAFTNEDIFLANLPEAKEQAYQEYSGGNPKVMAEIVIDILKTKLKGVMNPNTLKKYCGYYRKTVRCEVTWETAKRSNKLKGN